MNVILRTTYDYAFIVHQTHLIHNKPGIFGSLSFRSTRYGSLEFPKESASGSIGYKRAVLNDLGLNLNMGEIAPTPCGLAVDCNLILVLKGARGVELRGGRSIID